MGLMSRSFSSSPIRNKPTRSLNSSLSFASQDTQAILQQLLPNSTSFHQMKSSDSSITLQNNIYANYLKTSMSFDSELKQLARNTSNENKSVHETGWPLTKRYPHESADLILLNNPVLLPPDAFTNNSIGRNRDKNGMNEQTAVSPELNKSNNLKQSTGRLESSEKPQVSLSLPISNNTNSNNNRRKSKDNCHTYRSSSSCSATSASSSSSYFNSMGPTCKEIASLTIARNLINNSSLKSAIDLNEFSHDPVQNRKADLSHLSFSLNSNNFSLEVNENWQSSFKSGMDFHEKQPYHHYYQHRTTSNYMPLKSIDNRNRAEDESHHFKKSEIKDLIIQMNEALKCQREEIESLKRSQDAHQHQLKTCIDTSLKQFLLTQQQQQINAYMSTPANELQQNLINSLLVILEKIIKDEISKLMHSQFSMHVLEPLKEQISQELTEKLNSFESVFKDSALKLFISKPTMDTLSQSVVTSLQTNIVNSYRETFQKVVVPNFEKSCQNMYQQVNSSFAKGTQDYLIEFDKIAKLQRKSFDENKDPILLKMKQFSDKMQLHGSQVGTSIATSLQQQIESNLRDTNAILQDTIISSVKAIIKEELHLAMHDQQMTLPDILLNQIRQNGTLSSICHTPNSESNSSIFNSQQQQYHDIQMQITQHLKKGAINSAFQVALCAADLNLLENLCELVSPSQAFDPKSKLQQPVILSLIQQLGQDLSSNTELKIKYLEDAMVNLDLTLPLTIEHTPIVMNQLVMKLQQHIQMHPNDKMTRQCKMLLLASKSLNTQNQSYSNQGHTPINYLPVLHHDQLVGKSTLLNIDLN